VHSRSTLQSLTVAVAASLCSITCLPAVAAAENPLVKFETTEGAFVVELNAEKAPKTVENFLGYVKKGHYDGTIFHRVIKGFMIQGGGFDESLKEKPTEAPVRNEGGNGLQNEKYTLAMARTSDPHSATAQFFVNTKNNSFLNRDEARDGFGYTVFGKVIEGTETIDRIENARTRSMPHPEFPAMLMENVPGEPIVIQNAKLIEPDAN